MALLVTTANDEALMLNNGSTVDPVKPVIINTVNTNANNYIVDVVEKNPIVAKNGYVDLKPLSPTTTVEKTTLAEAIDTKRCDSSEKDTALLLGVVYNDDDLTNNNANRPTTTTITTATTTKQPEQTIGSDTIEFNAANSVVDRQQHDRVCVVTNNNIDRSIVNCGKTTETPINYSAGVNGSSKIGDANDDGISLLARLTTADGMATSALDVVRQMVGVERRNRRKNGRRSKVADAKYRENNFYLYRDDGGTCSSSSVESIPSVGVVVDKPLPTTINGYESDEEEEEEDNETFERNSLKSNTDLHKSLNVVVDDGLSCCDSSLGSSTTCSDDSFEVGAVEEFEISFQRRGGHFQQQQQRLVEENNGFPVADNGCSLNDGREPPKIDLALRNLSFVDNNRDQTLKEASSDGASCSDTSTPVCVKNDQSTTESSPKVGDTFTDPKSCLLNNNYNGSAPFDSNFNSLNNIKSRKSLVDDELSKLDTSLPQLDFEKLEQQLADAAKECEMNQRKLMSETVRQKLAMDSVEPPTLYPPAPTTRPLRSNLATRLQTGMNLQICFMNDTVPSEEEEDDDDDGNENDNEADEDEDDEDDCWRGVPKSFSTPNLRVPSLKSKVELACGLERSVSNGGGDSDKKASELRLAVQQQQAVDEKDFEKRRARLESETKLMLVKAKQAAHMQMELEKQAKLKRSVSSIEEIIGVPLGRKKLTRTQLTKMCITQLLIIINDLHSKIEMHNEELVHLLIDRDNLHMEQDSMLVDIEDLLQHQKSDQLAKLPDFLVATSTSAMSPQNSSGGGASSDESKQSSKFRIFKR